MVSARTDTPTRRYAIDRYTPTGFPQVFDYGPPDHRFRKPFHARTLYSIADVSWFNAVNGFHFFDVETLRFFSSRIGGTLYGGRFFVTSEQEHVWGRVWDGERRYSVRRVADDGSIDTVGDFGQYRDGRTANRAAQKLGSAELGGVK